MASPSRAPIRRALVAHLKGSVKAAAEGAIFAYQKGNLGTLSPVIRVLSGGSRRPMVTQQARGFRPFFRIQLWVLHSNTEGTWTEEMAEDKIDELEAQIADAIDAGDHNTGDSIGLSIEDLSEVQRVELSGKFYLMEEILVTVTVL